MSVVRVLTLTCLLITGPKRDAVADGKMCIDCERDRPIPPTPTPTPGPSTSTSTSTTTSGAETSSTDPGPDPTYFNERGGWKEHEHPPRTTTVRRAPTQQQSFIKLFAGGHVPLVGAGAPNQHDPAVPTGPVNSIAGVALGARRGLPYQPIKCCASLPNSPQRIELIGTATGFQQVDARARRNQQNLAPVMRNVVQLATTQEEPERTIRSVQHAATGLFGADHLSAWNAALVSAPTRIAETVDDVMRELAGVWRKAMGSADSNGSSAGD